MFVVPLPLPGRRVPREEDRRVPSARIAALRPLRGGVGRRGFKLKMKFQKIASDIWDTAKTNSACFRALFVLK